MLSGKLLPAKFMVISANASRIPLEIASLLPFVFWLEGQWLTWGTSLPCPLPGHLLRMHILFSLRAKGLVLQPPEAPWHRGNNGIMRKAGQ